MTGAPPLTTPRPMLDIPQSIVRSDWSTDLASPQLTILCDLDGPLIDVSQRYYKTYQLALSETQAYAQVQGRPLSLTPMSLAQFWEMKQSKQPDIEIAYLSGLAGESIDFFLHQVQIIVNQPLLLQEDRLQLGVHKSLEQLLNQGAQLAVVTLRCQSQVEQILHQYHLTYYFRLIRGTDNTQAAYTNYVACKQALIQDAIKAMGLTNHQQIWMIGDTEADVLAAQAVKIKTIALTCGMRNYAFLQNLQPTSIQSDLLTATQLICDLAVAT